MKDKAWYLVHTKPKREETAMANLDRQGYEAFLPRIRHQVRHSRRWRERVEALFPRYLFVRLDADNDNWAPLQSTTAVSTLVRFGQHPARVPYELIDGLRRRADPDGIVMADAPADFQPGQTVRVTEGPLAGIEGIVTRRHAHERVDVLLAIVGGNASARLNAHDLAPADR